MSFELNTKRNVLNNYGPRTTDEKFGGTTSDDVIKTAAWSFDYNDLPASGATNLQNVIPANARVLEALLEVITPFNASLTVGLETSAGVAIDADGLIAAAQASAAAAAVGGAVITGTGALIKKTVGTSAGELVVATTSTAGRGRVLVRYILAGV